MRKRAGSFLSLLRAALLNNGLSEVAADRICNGVRAKAQQPSITTLGEFQEAWAAWRAAQAISVTPHRSEVAAWWKALSRAIIDYENTYVTRHGHWPHDVVAIR
jgi:hypothetical protein